MIAAAQSLISAMIWLIQRLMFGIVLIAGLGLTGYTFACAIGQAPWLEMTATFGGVAHPEAGMLVQIALTAIMLGLCAFLPMNSRVMALETSHRRFEIGMQDVSKAYALAHREDRKGIFNLKSEFDSVRERIAFLRDHPELAELEPSVLEAASQMSHISRELAQVYSERNVARARDFLMQRQQEIEEFNARLDHAKGLAAELRVWVDKVELEESVAEAQLERLCDELTSILPEINMPEPEAVEESDDTLVAQDKDDWGDVTHLPDTDDDRIVALLARRAAE